MRIPVGKHDWAIVDEEDYEVLSKRKWHLTGGGYAGTTGGLLMHRMILEPPEGKMSDHKNGDPLDNRRSNLRVCTPKQNAANRRLARMAKTSQFKGVRFRPERGQWSAYIGTDEERDYLGCFRSEEQAGLAYNVAACSRFGKFARLNDITATGDEIAEVTLKLLRRRREMVYRERKRLRGTEMRISREKVERGGL